MNILIIGSGLIGVTTAYFLQKCGHEVIVVDRRDGPGLETSFANGAILTPSMSSPWNAPGSWRVLLSSLGRSDSAMQLRLGALPSLTGWGIQFLRNSSPAAYERNTRKNLHLALYSLEVMETLRQQAALDYGRASRGTLRIFRNRESLGQALDDAAKWASEGLPYRNLSVPETVALEPSLASVAGSLAGGIHYEIDEVGDAYRFCFGMMEAAKREGVKFHFGTEVQALRADSGRVSEVVTPARRFVADRYILCAGSYSPQLAHGVNVSLPVRPVKGYSITIDQPLTSDGLSIPIVDDQLHAVMTPLAGNIRVAGTAEFAGYDLQVRPGRIANLVRFVRAILPKAELDAARVKQWCGLRPMCVDGVPIIGPTPLSNLFVSTGHGHLGWTMAAGSAKLLADLICGTPASIDAAPFALSRFAVGR